MKIRFALLFAIILAIATSCKTQKNVLYLQDLDSEGVIAAQAEKYLTLKVGDKLSINVNSSNTPDLAVRFMTPLINTKSSGFAGSTYQTLYTVNENGYITVPGLDPIKVTGMTRSQLADYIQNELRKEQLKDAVVTVDCYQRYVTVLGEVRAPGRYEFARDNMTLLEALGAAGDLNIQAKRSEIIVIREVNGKSVNYLVDLRSKELFNSPAYHLEQNDIIYVAPNRFRQGQSTVNDNSLRSVGTWLSIASVVTSITILITNATK